MRSTYVHGTLLSGRVYGICSNHRQVVQTYMHDFLLDTLKNHSERPLLYMAEDLAIQEKGFRFFKSRFKYSATLRSRLRSFIKCGIEVFFSLTTTSHKMLWIPFVS